MTIEPFVTGTEVNQYRDEKLEWLSNIENEPRIVPVYFKEERIKDFIVQTSMELTGLFKDWDFKQANHT